MHEDSLAQALHSTPFRVPSESAVRSTRDGPGRRVLSPYRRVRKQWWAGTGLNRRHQDFQTRPQPSALTNDLLVSSMIRSLRGVDLTWCCRITTDGYA